MDKLTIPIPDGLPDDQKRDLAGWLTQLAREATSPGPGADADPAAREEITRRIKRGMADFEAGRFCDAREAMRRIAERHGLTPPAGPIASSIPTSSSKMSARTSRISGESMSLST